MLFEYAAADFDDIGRSVARQRSSVHQEDFYRLREEFQVAVTEEKSLKPGLSWSKFKKAVSYGYELGPKADEVYRKFDQWVMSTYVDADEEAPEERVEAAPSVVEKEDDEEVLPTRSLEDLTHPLDS